MTTLLIHRHAATTAATPVNAYVVESPDELVVVDATLTVADGRALRDRVAALDKPLAGVIITHAHPDHYGGLVELLAGRQHVPVHATQSVIDAIVRDDPVKEQILRPMFGDQWPARRTFPDTPVADGATLRLGRIALRVSDLGPGESPADSIWALSDGRVFSADLAYGRHHCYLADGFHEPWLANLDRLQSELPPGATLHPGHGLPCGLEVLDWQRGYIHTMLHAIDTADWSDHDHARAQVAAHMRAYLPTETLAFLMELSIDALVPQSVTG